MCLGVKIRLIIEMLGIGMCIVVLFNFLLRLGKIRLIVWVVLVDVGIMLFVVVCVWCRFEWRVLRIG